MNVLTILGCLMAGATIGILLMACPCAASDADDCADAMPRTLKEFDEAKAERTLYDALRKVQ